MRLNPRVTDSKSVPAGTLSGAWGSPSGVVPWPQLTKLATVTESSAARRQSHRAVGSVPAGTYPRVTDSKSVPAGTYPRVTDSKSVTAGTLSDAWGSRLVSFAHSVTKLGHRRFRQQWPTSLTVANRVKWRC